MSEWTIYVYIPGRGYWDSWDGMALEGITYQAAWALAYKLNANHGHDVLLVDALQKDWSLPFGERAEEWAKNPPKPPPVEIKTSKHQPL